MTILRHSVGQKSSQTVLIYKIVALKTKWCSFNQKVFSTKNNLYKQIVALKRAGCSRYFFPDAHDKSGVLLRRQLMKCQLSRQMFVRKLLFLVCCFFSLIWNVSKLNLLKTKCKLSCQNEFFGKLFLKSGNTSVYFFMFSLLRFNDEQLTFH